MLHDSLCLRVSRCRTAAPRRSPTRGSSRGRVGRSRRFGHLRLHLARGGGLSVPARLERVERLQLAAELFLPGRRGARLRSAGVEQAEEPFEAVRSTTGRRMCERRGAGKNGAARISSGGKHGRRLWGSGKGNYTTSGSYGSATVPGTARRRRWRARSSRSSRARTCGRLRRKHLQARQELPQRRRPELPPPRRPRRPLPDLRPPQDRRAGQLPLHPVGAPGAAAAQTGRPRHRRQRLDRLRRRG